MFYISKVVKNDQKGNLGVIFTKMRQHMAFGIKGAKMQFSLTNILHPTLFVLITRINSQFLRLWYKNCP